MSAIFNQEGFCFIYTAQVGVIILSCVGLTLVSISIAINATARDPKLDLFSTLMRWFIFGSFMLLCIFTYMEGLLSVFMGHNSDYNKRHAIIAATGQAVVIVAWLGLIVSSYFVGPYEIRYICINNRCADRLFLQPSGKRYNTRQYEVNPLLAVNSRAVESVTKQDTDEDEDDASLTEPPFNPTDTIEDIVEIGTVKKQDPGTDTVRTDLPVTPADILDENTQIGSVTKHHPRSDTSWTDLSFNPTNIPDQTTKIGRTTKQDLTSDTSWTDRPMSSTVKIEHTSDIERVTKQDTDVDDDEDDDEDTDEDHIRLTEPPFNPTDIPDQTTQIGSATKQDLTSNTSWTDRPMSSTVDRTSKIESSTDSGNNTGGTSRPFSTTNTVRETTKIVSRHKIRCYGGFVNWILSVILSFFIFR